MSDIVKPEQHPVSAAALEHILGTGDLSKLSTEQRVEYYVRTCQSLGLNPLTRPFRFLSLNGQTQLYATKDATDQLRSVRGITLHIVDKQIDSDLYVVTARARSKDGREDEDIGAVMLPRSGESRANALMKGTTKAKRRVTLSICGLGGMVDESELDTMPGAMTFDADEEPPVAPIRDAREQMNRDVPLKAAASEMKRPPRVTVPPPKPHPMMPNGPVDPNPYEAPPKPAPRIPRTGAEWSAWVDRLQITVTTLRGRREYHAITDAPAFQATIEAAPPPVRRDIDAILADTYENLPAEPIENDPTISGEELPEVEIKGEANIMACD